MKLKEIPESVPIEDDPDWDLTKAWFRLNDYCNSVQRENYNLHRKVADLERQIIELEQRVDLY